MRQLLIGLLLVVVVGASLSAFMLSSQISNNSNSQTESVATSAAYSYSRDAAGGLIELVNTTSGRIVGCNTLATTVSNQGYSLKVYISSYSPNTSDSLCVNAVFHDDTAVPLTLSEGIDLGVSITVTDSNGNTVMSGTCHPSIPPPVNGTSPNPPQGLQCGDLWDTQAPVNGITPHTGTYHVNVVGSLFVPGNQTFAGISTGLIASVNSEVNVVLSSG